MKTRFLLAPGAFIIIVGLGKWTQSSSDAMVEKLHSGEAILQCEMLDGVRIIDPNKVVGFTNGTWRFTNGSASSCEIIE